MKRFKAVTDAAKSIFVSCKTSSDNTRRKFQLNDTQLQIETLEPRMMLNGDSGQVLFRAGFEDANVAAGQFAFFREVSGFTATNSAVEIQNNHPAVGPAPEGQRHLELDGRNGIFVEIDDIQATGLTLEVEYSARGGASLQQNEIEILWNGSVVETLSADGSGLQSTNFNRFSIDLPIDGGSTAGRLEFRSKFAGNGGLGGLLDNVVVSAELSPIAIGDIPDQEVQRGATVNVDADLLPPNENATDTNYQLVRAPVGATIDPATGEFHFEATDENVAATENRETETVTGPVQTVVFAGFEDVEVSNRRFDFFDSLSGFEATGPAVEVQQNHPSVGPASEGNQHVELDGRNGIARSIATQQGDVYELIFDYSPRAGADAVTNAIEILWDGEVIREVTGDGTNNSTTNFRSVRLDLSEFSGDTTRLEFRSKERGTGLGLGGLIDNVRVTRREVTTVTSDNPFEVIIRATDDNGRSDDEQFNITISDAPVQQAPVFDTIDEITINEQESVSFQLTATDADGPTSELRYEAIQIPLTATLDPVTGQFDWQTDEASGGLFFNVDVRVTDADGLSDTQRIRITVNEANVIPVLQSIDDVAIDAGQSISIQSVATDSDVPMDTLTFSLSDSPEGATITDQGLIQWTTPTTEGTFTFTVRVNDGNGGSATESFDVIVGSPVDTITLVENNDFLSSQSRELTVGPDVNSLSFQFTPEFDTAANFVNDAFEVALVDEDGQTLVHAFNQDRDAFFNLTEGEDAIAGINAIQTGDTVSLDLSHITEGTVANLVFRLVNNDSDTQTRVTITNIETSAGELGTAAGVSFAQNRLAQQTPVDFTLLQDVTESFTARFGQTSFNEQSDELFTNIALTNVGQVAVSGRMIAVIRNISDAQIALIEPDGRLPDGRFYIDISSDSGTVAPGETARTRDFRWLNEASEAFQFELTLLAEVNLAPNGFTSTPPSIVEAGQELSYTAVAIDPDEGQALRYNIVRGNEAVTINEDTGVLSWITATENIGNNRITVRATDPFGLFTEQTFTVEVVESLQNRPPVFTTSPETEATASSGFEVTTLATGDNPNGVGVISGFEGPRIVTINSDDQTVGVYEGSGNDRFDDETVYSTGEPERTGFALNGGYTVDIGLPTFENNSDVNDIFGLDQADFNGDGILDLVSLTYHRSNVTRDGFFHNVVVNFGDGNGDFGEGVIVEQFDFLGKADFQNLTVADINGDGQSDLVWIFSLPVFRGDPQFSLYTVIGNGDGTFQPTVVTSEGDGIGDFRVVDLDQDGNVDLVGRRQFVDDIGWLQGVGDGTFNEFVSLTPGDTFTPLRDDFGRDFQVVDVDDDGDLDIVQARRVDRGIQVLTNDGDLNFTETAVLGAGNSLLYHQALQVADFTGDGNVDIFYTLSSDNHYRLFKGTADGFEDVSVEATALNPHNFVGNPAGDDSPIDIDGDGDLDLLIGKSDPGFGTQLGARVLLNDGTGFFSSVGYSAIVDSNGQPNQDEQRNLLWVAGVLTGDYNQDGVADLAYYSSGVGFSGAQSGVSGFHAVNIALGTRPGEFAANSTLPGFTRLDEEPVAADFNNDGLVDILSLREGMIRLGSGGGNFDTPFQATSGQGLGITSFIADFNQDGNIDLVLQDNNASTTSGLHRVLLGNGDGTLELSYQFFDPQGGFLTASTVDFNGDGFPDIVSKGDFSHLRVQLYDPTNPGNFIPGQVIEFEATSGYGEALDVGDFDEDGIVDFVTVERTDGRVRLQTYKGLGDGTFELVNEEFDFNEALVTAFDTFGQSPVLGLHAEDVNKDGHLDVVNFSSVGNLIHLGNGDGTFAKPSFGYADFASGNDRLQTEVIDFDGDGNLDLVRVNADTLGISKGFGDGTFDIPERYTFVGNHGRPFFADLDNDGHLDIVFKSSGIGGATLTDAKVFYGTRDGLVDALTVDLNGDGNEEVLAINEDNDRLKIFVGDNLGGLTRLNDVLVGRAPRAVAAADLDGDGTQELITANRAGRSISVLTGDLASGYTVADFDIDGAPVDVEVSDVDGDGNADIVLLDEFNNALWVFAGNGTTTLDAPTAIALGDVPSRFILADATGDGEIDAVVTLPETNRVMILGGIGGATPAAPIFVTTESAPSDVAVADLNDDGNADLAITLPESGVLSVHYGLGNSQFARAQQITVGDTPTRVTTADADEDGRIDLVVTNSGDNTASVIFNRFDPNEVYRYDADAIDPDSDNIAYRVADGPGGLFVDADTGEVIWAASPDQVGQHTVILEANDGNGGIATQQFVIDVQPAEENSAPLIATEPVATIGANESFEYQVGSIDNDNDSLRYRIIDGPEGATIDPITGLLEWDGRTDAALQLNYGGPATSTQGNVVVLADESLEPENITVEGWYNFHDVTASRMVVLKQDQSANFGFGPFTYQLQIRGNSELVLEFDYEDGEDFEIATPFVAETDRWFHFAFTFDDATREATIYVDGEAVSSGVAPESLLFTGFNAQVGQGQSGFPTFATIDNYRIWNVARSAEQIQEGLTRHYEDNDQIVLDYRFEDNNTSTVFDHSSSENTGFLTPDGRHPIPVPGLANAGIHSFTIGVEDGRGGMTTQTFDVEIVAELRGAISGTITDESTGDGLSDWLVFLDENNNQFADPDELQTTTDADGNYEFNGLLPGDYPVRVAPVAGFEGVGLQNANVVANENTVTDVVARQLELSQIQGQLTTTDGESISYWTIYTDLDNDGVRDSDEPVATTDRDGFFAIAGLDAGEYNLRADLPAGWAVDGDDNLIVNLAADAISTGNDFVVAPTNTSVTGGVHFVTTAPAEIAARDVFRYASVAIGISNQAITYDISLGPDGLSIDPNTGQVAWQPTIEQLGEQLVILRATDDSGSVALQSFTIVVTAPNTAPVITSDAPTLSFVDLALAYDVVAQDAEQDDLTYAILSGGDGATIDDQGRLLWTPATGDLGDVDFEIEVHDSVGNSATQSFTVTVSNDQPAATPFVITSPRTEVGLGQRYLARVSGVDQLDRALEWSLVSGPTDLTVDTDGILSWNAASSDLGDQTIELLATNADGKTESYELVLSVVGRPVIQAPVIESTPLLSSVIGNEYQYDVVATDPDGDVLSFALLDAPQGASIDASRGTIRWTPQADQLGESEITVEVTDPDGATDTQTFTLRVSRAGGPPIITSTPTTEVNVGGSFLYSVVARDAEGDPLTYRLLDAPDGATISETTGELSWTPTANQVGQQTIIIEVADGFGGASTQAFSVLVGDGVVNLPPQIESEAPRFAAVGGDYQYQITANDPEVTSLSYSIGRGPTGLSVDSNGLVTWTPAAGQVGQFVVTLIVTDANGASAIESFELDVLAENSAPVINSFAPAEHFAGEEFQYDVLVTDADSDPLRFELVNGPVGASIDPFGRVRWATDNDSIGTHDFEVLVTDPRGGEVTQTFTLGVVADTVAPTLLLSDLNNEDGRNILPWQGPIRVFARASDNVGIASLTLTANGEDIPLDANGQVAFEFEEYLFNNINVVATAIDVNGNVTTRSIDIDFDIPEGWTAADGPEIPTAIISSPLDADTVTGVVSITGTAAHEDFAIYRLSYRGVNETTFTEFARGNSAVENGELGVWDTSLLRNDEYVIRLEVATADGVANIVEQNVGVSGELKLGNFETRFTDLVIPVNGIPIQVTRVYDSLNADVESDFGFGTRLEFRNTDLQIGLPSSGLEDIGLYQALRPGVKIYLNVPGQGRQGFTFDPEIRVLPGFGGDENLVVARPRFVADPDTTATLATGVSGFLRVNEQGQLFAPGNIPYNPASPDFGGSYQLSTRDGITYSINGATGMLDSAADRNGNQLVFSESGISANGEELVQIVRDANDRIASIIDAEGNRLEYGYSASGDLVSFTDRNGNEATLEYDSQRPHFLTGINGANGQELLRNEYDEDGRLNRVFDLNGNPIEINFDPENRIQTVTDSFGQTTLREFDSMGNTVSVIDGLGNRTSQTFDANGNVTSNTNASGETATFVHDSNGNVIRQVDRLGNSTQFDYEGDQLTSLTDALGNTTVLGLDERGNVTSITDPLGNTTTVVRDEKGNAIQSTDALGRAASFEYSSTGRLLQQTSPSGVTTRFQYNHNGLVTGTEVLGDDGAVLSTQAITYDANGNVISTVDGEGNEVVSELNSSNQVIRQVNEEGIESTQAFFDNGQVQSVTQDGVTLFESELDEATSQLSSITALDGRTVGFEYDAAGRPISRTTTTDGVDSVQEFQFDESGRLEAITSNGESILDLNLDANFQLAGLDLESAGSSETQFDANGNISRAAAAGNSAVYKYDELGRLVELDSAEVLTEIEYDAAGQIVQSSIGGKVQFQYDYNADGQLSLARDGEGSETTYQYNELGLLQSATDSNDNTTLYEYDRAGRLTAMIRPDGSRTEAVFNGTGQLTERNNADGSSIEFSYSRFGLLASRTDDAGNETTVEFDSQGRRIRDNEPFGTVNYTYDAFSRLVRRDDPGGGFIAYEYNEDGGISAVETPGGTTEYTYDEEGRLFSVIRDGEQVASYEYDQLERISAVNRSNGIRETITYDQFGLLRANVFTDDSGNVIFSLENTRDLQGRVILELRNDGSSIEYDYNDANYLTTERHFSADQSLDFEILYEYDGVGNRLRLTDSRSGIVTYTYDQNDRLIESIESGVVTTYQYDANGNLASEFVDQQNQTLYQFDSSGRLIQIDRTTEGLTEVTEYQYSIDGVRVAEIVDGVERRFIFDAVAQLPDAVESYDANGQTLSSGIYGVGLLAEESGNDQRFLYTDNLGSIRMTSDAQGGDLKSQNYTAFGVPVNELANEIGRGFLAEQSNSSTGLTFLRARYYDVSTGRFISVDPLEGLNSIPISRHDYVYAANDPRNITDPTGLTTQAEVLTSTSIVNTLFNAGIAAGISSVIGNAIFGSEQFDGNTLTVELGRGRGKTGGQVSIGNFTSQPIEGTINSAFVVTLGEVFNGPEFEFSNEGIEKLISRFTKDLPGANLLPAPIPDLPGGLDLSVDIGSTTVFQPAIFPDNGVALSGPYLSGAITLTATSEQALTASIGSQFTVLGIAVGANIPGITDESFDTSIGIASGGPGVTLSASLTVGISISIPIGSTPAPPASPQDG